MSYKEINRMRFLQGTLLKTLECFGCLKPFPREVLQKVRTMMESSLDFRDREVLLLVGFDAFRKEKIAFGKLAPCSPQRPAQPS